MKIRAVMAALLLILTLLLTASCGKDAGEPTDPAGTGESVSGDASAVEAGDVEQKLREALEKDGYPVKDSPVYSYLERDGEGVSYDYTSLDTELGGAYTLKFTDTDGDGQNELLVFRLVNENPYVLDDDTRLTRYFLFITGYDLTEDGEVASDFLATGLNTGAIFELEGLSRCYAGEKDGTITVLSSFEYVDTDYYYSLSTFKNGVFNKEVEYRFNVSREPGEDDAPAFVSGGKCDRYAPEAFIDGTRFEGSAGSPEVESYIAASLDEIREAGLSDCMFPLQESGETKSGDVFDDRCDIKFGPVYDSETDRLCLYIEGKNGE